MTAARTFTAALAAASAHAVDVNGQLVILGACRAQFGSLGGEEREAAGDLRTCAASRGVVGAPDGYESRESRAIPSTGEDAARTLGALTAWAERVACGAMSPADYAAVQALTVRDA